MIAGIVAAVPSNTVKNDDEAFIKATGVHERRIAKDQDTVDLGYMAAIELMRELHWLPSQISAIIVVTQTPANAMPGNAAILADMLACKCPAFDVNMACSGYLYGLAIADKFVDHGAVILIAGDTVSKMIDKWDKSTTMLFGDCVTATGISAPHRNEFALGTDGSGHDKLIADPNIRMNGAEVMSFALKTVPALVQSVTADRFVECFLFHQANEMILKHLAKKCAIPLDQVPMNIAKYGNTSSASIPLLMCDSSITLELRQRHVACCMVGFGAGWSWGATVIGVGPLSVCKVVEVS